MAIFLQDLDQRFPIVDPETGRPTDYFLRLLRGQTGDLAEGVDDADAEIAAIQARTVTAGFGLSGGGDLSASRTIDLGDPALTDPNADRMLFWDDSAGQMDWLTPGTNLTITDKTINASAGSGSFAFIQRTAFTAVANVDIPLSNTYDAFRIEFYLTASVDGTGLNAAYTSDNFVTILAGATDYAYSQLRSAAAATAVTSSSGTSVISLAVTATIGNAAGEFASGIIEVLNAKETAPTNADCRMNYVTAAAAYGVSRTMSSYKPTTSLDGIRLSPLSGTVTGFYKLWGLTV